MKFLLVDDEPYALKDLKEAVCAAEPDCEIAAFSLASQALQYARDNPFDVAFLDIELGSINGLVLAKKIKDILPKAHIIFVTSHEKYAVDAFQIHAVGYLMKPVLVKDITRELTFIYGTAGETKNRMQVQTFGGFAVYVDGKLLKFKRSKAMELLAYLIDRQGAPSTTREACAVLWEDKPYDIAQKNYFQNILLDLRVTLREHGVEDILIRSHNQIAIAADRLDCDSYSFLNGEAWAVNRYQHDYLPSYSWAEFRLGELEQIYDKSMETYRR